MARTPNAVARLASRIAAPFRRGLGMLGYHAVEDKKRRRPASGVLRDEETELTASDRNRLVSDTRDLYRNFSIASWAIRKHLDYVSTFTFQSRNKQPELDRRIEDLVRWWSRRTNCDVTGRHNLARLIRIAEARAVVDGDVFLLKLADGRLQAIEGDRVRTPFGGVPSQDAGQWRQGVKTDAAGRPLAYCVCKRNEWGGFAFERTIRSGAMLQHGYFDRFDQLRGVSPLAPALNTFVHLYESLEYALMKAKVSQLFGLAVYRADAEVEYLAPDLSKGAFCLNLGDYTQNRAEFLENKTPSVEFKEFTLAMIMAALKALDIPYSFYAENFTNYSGARQALLQYEQSAQIKQRNIRELLDALVAWRLQLFVDDGVLALPEGLGVADLRWEWVPAGLPWIDPLKEIQADAMALANRLTSRQRIAKRRGEDWWEINAECAEEEDAGAPRARAMDALPEEEDSPEPNRESEREEIAA